MGRGVYRGPGLEALGKEAEMARTPGLAGVVRMQLQLMGIEYRLWADPELGVNIYGRNSEEPYGSYYWHEAYRKLFGREYRG